MLISVNGTIINTKRIYKITKIGIYNTTNKGFIYIFTIFFNNTEKLNVLSNDYSWEEVKNFNKYEPSEVDLFSNFRESIIKIWQENQTQIPQFNN